MFEIFQYILLFLGLAVAGLLAYAATKPAHGRTARTVTIKASPERIFPLIDNLRSMNLWNPFVKTDPNLKGAYSGPDSGKGAAYAFDGNKNAGAGHITITDSVPPSKVTMNLIMTRPFACDNIVEFTLVPADDGMTAVTWAMSGPCPYFMRVMGTLFNMERMMQGTFDKGLADLKAIAER
jgi:uncharacterized protein YndB with AHSA1/START domain